MAHSECLKNRPLKPGRRGRPPHAPERGWVAPPRLVPRRQLRYRFHLWGVRFLPSPLVGVFIAIFTTFFFPVLRRIRAAIASNLEPVLGPCGWWERQRRIYRTMWSLGWCLSERYERLGTNRAFQVEAEGREIWDQVARPEKGLLLVTAHLGNYEVGSMLPSQLDRRSVRIVREPEVDARAQAFFQNIVDRFQEPGYTTHFQTDDPLQGMALLEALRRGEIIAVQGDRPRAGTRSIDTTLFGRPFPLPPGPAALCGRRPACRYSYFARGGGAYRAVFRPPISGATANRAADPPTRCSVAAEVEWAISQRAASVYCFKRLWE
jgi:lauroyl/myristoyl acyltransferase